jgi:flagellar assembly factor FliW
MLFLWGGRPVKAYSSRFGEMDVRSEDIINFPEGILGFEGSTKFFVIDPNDGTLVLWLQSASDANIAFPIVEPQIFKPDYSPGLMPADMRSVNLESAKQAKVYTILTIPADISKNDS